MITGYSFHGGDLFHQGHLHQLLECRKHCDHLTVGVLTDKALASYKQGPIIPYEQRAAIYMALSCVDAVWAQDSRDPTENLKILKPDVLFHGDDWSYIPGSDWMAANGGRTIKTPYCQDVSTTAIVEKIRAEAETAVIILAATPEPNSWNSDEPRHLVNIHGEPLILRTLRQLSEMGYDATVITDKPEVQAVVPRYLEPENRRWIVSTILSSREAWRDRVVILPGDVVWDIYILGFILGCNNYPAFYGDAKEILAMTWLRGHFERVVSVLEGVGRTFDRDGGWCWLWHFYRVLCGRDIYDNDMHGEWEDFRVIRTMHTPARSCTTDLDTIEEYHEWLSRP